MNADFRSVITGDGHALQFNPKTHFGKVGHTVVVRQYGKQSDSVFGSRVNESFSVIMLAHDVDQAQTFAPKGLLIVVESFAQHLINVVGPSPARSRTPRW